MNDPNPRGCGPSSSPSLHTFVCGQASSVAMSRSSIPVATTLSDVFDGSVSWMSHMSVLAGSSRRAAAICRTVLPAYSGFGENSPMSRSSGLATCSRMKSVSARSSKLRFG